MYKRVAERFVRSGFSLVELLVVIGIITVVISILLPALHSAREQAKMIVCRNNLRQIGIAATNYTASYRGVYPAGTLFHGGNVLTDVSEFTTSELMAAGTARPLFYCPFLLDHSVEPVDRMWNLDSTALYYHVAGYYFLFGRDPQSIIGLAVPKRWKYKVTDVGPLPDDTELATDITLSIPAWPVRRFYDIDYYGVGSGTPLVLTTSHLRDKVPQGGNVLFMDGHIDWRPFSEMQNRLLGGGDGGFWF